MTPDIKDQTVTVTQNNTQSVYQELQHEKCISAAFQPTRTHDEAHSEHTLTAPDHTLQDPSSMVQVFSLIFFVSFKKRIMNLLIMSI